MWCRAVGLCGEVAKQFLAVVDQSISIAIECEPCVLRSGLGPSDFYWLADSGNIVNLLESRPLAALFFQHPHCFEILWEPGEGGVEFTYSRLFGDNLPVQWS